MVHAVGEELGAVGCGRQRILFVQHLPTGITKRRPGSNQNIGSVLPLRPMDALPVRHLQQQ